MTKPMHLKKENFSIVTNDHKQTYTHKIGNELLYLFKFKIIKRYFSRKHVTHIKINRKSNEV